MRRGWFRYIAAGSGLAVLLLGAPAPVAAEGNAGLHLHKTVDPLQLTITPGIGITLGVDKSTAIPGDTLTYTAVVSNPTATFGMGGYINAQAVASTDANVAYYWDQLEYCATGCGNGAANPNWTALATFEAGQPGYVPVTTPALHTGMTFAAVSVTRSGVIYPASGDPILGTQISPSATAAWTYRSTVVLTPAQIALLSNPALASAVRNVLHFEVTERNTTAAQPYTDPETFASPFTSASNPGAISNITVTFTLPDGTTVAVGPAQVPALGLLNPGATATVTAQFKVPVPAPRGASESEASYLLRLMSLNGLLLSATAVAAGSGFSGAVYATSAPAVTQENVPIVTIAKSGPAVVNAGDTETNPLALRNPGGATAASLAVVDTVPAGASGTVTGVPASLAAGASASAGATYAVPISQASGDLTDTASVTWTDGNGNPYGSLSSSFTTQVHNILFGASLVLAPASAGPNIPGSTQTLTATLRDSHGNPIANQLVHFTITGANAGSGTATTDASGNAPFTYTGTNAGNDVVQATVTAPGITISSNTSAVSWLKVLQPVVTTAVQGNFYPNAANSCTFDAGPGSTPAFGQTFPDILFNPSASVVPHDISNVTNFTRPFTDLTVDVNGNYNGQIVAQGNGQQAGTGSLINFYGQFTGNFVVSQPGDLTFRILHDDGYILGVGGGATRVNGDLEGNPPATTPFNGYGVVAAWNTSSTGSSSSGPATVHFPAAGTYPYELDYTECGGGALFLNLLTEQFIAQTSPLSIYVGYGDGLRAGGSVFPFPWLGSPNTNFIGCTACQIDAGAIRFDNNSPNPITFDSITVDIGSIHLDIWPHGVTLAAGQILIVTQTSEFNFDTSDFSSSPCFVNNGVIPNVNVTIGGATTVYPDTNQVINTTGFDQACAHNENHPWTRIAGTATAINVPVPPAVALNLTPFNVPGAIQGQTLALTVSALDGAGNAVTSLPVMLQVTGANTQTLTGTTGVDGLVAFSYVGLSPGADTVQASAFVGGLRSISNQGSVVWTPPGGTNNPLGPSIGNQSPADGSVITKPVAVDATIAPPAGQSIASWRVFYQAANGGPQVVIGSGSGAPPSPLGVTFDPTVLADGSYTLTVEATAGNGATQDVSSGISVIGGLKLGRYTTTFQDMSVPVIGVQLEVQRSYDSIDTATSGDFGFGWRVSVSNFRESTNHTLGAGGWTQYNKSCTLGLCFTAFKNAAPRFVTVVFPDGHSEIFDFTPAGGTNIFWGCSPAFTARASAGTTSTLVALDDTGCSYSGDGNIYGASGVYNPHRFQLTTRDGRVIVLDHNSGLISLTDRNGNRLSVDANGIHASNGQGILFTRDGSGRITQVSGPAAGQSVTYTYSTAGDLATSRDPLGNTDTYSYDSAHHLLKVSGPQGAISSETYDSSGRLTSITDAGGHTTQIQNDVAGQSSTYTDAIGNTTTAVTSDDLGNVVREDISAGGQTLTLRFTYDSTGHVTTKTDALGHSIHAAYDAQGDLTRYTDADGNATQLTYDSTGLVTSVVAPDGGVLSSATYDPNGNPVSILGPGGAVIHYSYDSSGRPLARTDATGNTIGYAYDPTSRISSITDATGQVTRFGYDAANRPTTVTDALGNIVGYTYDAGGNMIGITDPRGNSESFTYNSFGNVTAATDPLGGTAGVTYDANGHVTSAVDRAGNAISYSYDADGRLTRINYPGGEFLAFTLDGFGRPTALANSSSSISNSYDAAGNLIATTTNAAAFGSATLRYTYDAAGNRLSSTGPDGTVSYSYDSNGRVITLTDARGGSFGINYDSSSKITSLTRPNGITDAYTYDSNGRLVGIASKLGPTTIQNLSQTINANGQVASTTDAGGTTTYTHDPDGRLVAVSGPGAVSQSYAYDAAGNRISGPLSTSSTYNATDELTSDAGFNYTYDAEGQRISKVDKSTGATTRYTYDGAKRLTSIQFPDGTTSTYTYDPLGRRLTVTGGGATTAYVYDGVNTRLEYSSSGLAASYVGTGQVDQPLEMTRGGSAYYYLQNFQGSVTDLTNASGSVAASYSYDAFGVPTSAAATVANPFTFTGREYDAKSGLYYNRARYYDPATGAFTSQDAVSSGQRYGYAGGDPVDFTDPSGAFFAEIASLYARATAQANRMKLIGCGLAAYSAVIEIELNVAARQKLNWASFVAIGAGVVTACAVGYLGGAAASFRTLIGLPLAAAFIAGLVDLALEAICASQTNNWSGIHPEHVIAIGLSAFAIGAGAAILPALLPAAAPLENQFEVALGSAILSGDAAAVSDLTIGGGACG